MSASIIASLEQGRGPEDALAVLTTDPASRKQSVINALRAEADREQVVAARASRLRQIADFLEAFHASIRAFEQVSDLGALVNWFELYEFSFYKGLPIVLERFAEDASGAADVTRTEALRRALGVLARLMETLEFFNQIGSSPPEDRMTLFETRTELCDPQLRRWLYIAAVRCLDAAPERSQRYLWARETLGSICRLLDAIRSPRIETMPDGQQVVHWPTNAIETEFWFAMHARFDEYLLPTVQAVALGDQSFAVAWKSIESAVPAEHDQRVAELSAFLVAVLVFSGLHVEEVLAKYRALLDPASEVIEVQATNILRYASSLAQRYRLLPAPRPLLEDALALLTLCECAIDVTKSPRLARDIAFTRARLLEDLGTWDPTRYAQAEASYRRGLSIAGADHEREAVGRALGDLANQLHRRRLDHAGDREVDFTYRLALAHLPAEEFPLGRSTVLVNHSAYLQERTLGDLAQNQERALAQLNESVELLSGLLDRGVPDGAAPSVRVSLASTHLTLGNVLRFREFGTEKARLDRAEQSYLDGLRVLGAQRDELYWLLRIAQAFLSLDRYWDGGDIGYLGRADRALEEVQEEAVDLPHLSARVAIERAGLVLLDDSADADRLDTTITSVRSALTTLKQFGALRELADGWRALGRLLRKRASATSAEASEAVVSFRRAFELYITVGADERAIGAARSSASILVESSLSTGNDEDVRQAREELGKAATLFEAMIGRNQAIGQRFELASRFGGVYAELLWCAASLGEKRSTLWELATRAKNRELMSQVSALGRFLDFLTPEKAERLEELRMSAHQTEFEQFEAATAAEVDQSLWQQLRGSAKAMRDAHDRMKLLGWKDEPPSANAIQERLASTQDGPVRTAIIDFTVSRWGTVLLVRTPDGSEYTRTVPFTTGRLHELLWEGTTAWCETYQQFQRASARERPAKEDDFRQATRVLIDALSQELVSPGLDGLAANLAGVRLLIVPGPLAGLPLHACRYASQNSGLLFELVAGFAYAPSAGTLARYRKHPAPVRGLCVLSSPDSPETPPLDLSPEEVGFVTEQLVARGAAVTILASKANEVGEEVFKSRALRLPAGVTVERCRPTPSELKARFPHADFIFYSGHGVASGLIATDDQGAPARLLLSDLMMMPSLSAVSVVHLSACENAREEGAGSAEMLSFVSGLLRRGAGFVVAGLWFVFEKSALQFTKSFHARLAAGDDPPEALRQALVELKGFLAAQRGDDPVAYATFAGFAGA